MCLGAMIRMMMDIVIVMKDAHDVEREGEEILGESNLGLDKWEVEIWES